MEEKAVAPFLHWCEMQAAAKASCLLSAARVTGNAGACTQLKGSERTSCLLAAAIASGQTLPCRTLPDREMVQCTLAVAAETRRDSACEALANVRWQGGGSKALCLSVARGEVAGCPSLATGGELASWCVRDVALAKRDASVCTKFGDATEEAQRCAVAVAVARRAPQDCAPIFSPAPPGAAQHHCEVDAAVAAGQFPPCLGDPALCERYLWVPRPCEGAPAAWADACLLHQAVFSTGPFGCGAVADKKRRALCAQLRDAEEGYLVRTRGADAGTVPASSR